MFISNKINITFTKTKTKLRKGTKIEKRCKNPNMTAVLKSKNESKIKKRAKKGDDIHKPNHKPKNEDRWTKIKKGTKITHPLPQTESQPKDKEESLNLPFDPNCKPKRKDEKKRNSYYKEKFQPQSK